MPKIIKISAFVVGGLLGVVLIVMAIIAATFNPNDYKPDIIKMVQEKKQRTLSIPGEIKLMFFPSIGVDLGKVSISEHKSDATFASVEHARVSVALLPLLSKQVVVDRIVIDGAHIVIRRFKDNRTNFDDLLAKDEESDQQVKLEIDGIKISNSNITIDDRLQKRNIALTNLQVDTGKIANGERSKFEVSVDIKADQPAVNAKVQARSGFMVDLEQQHFVLNGIDTTVKGQLLDFTDALLVLKGDADLKPVAKRFGFDDLEFTLQGKQAAQSIDLAFTVPKLSVTDNAVAGNKLSGKVHLAEGSRTVSATLAMPSFEGTPAAFKLPVVTLDATLKDKGLDARTQLSGALTGNLDKMVFSSPQLTLALDGKQDGNAINGSLRTPLTLDLRTKKIDLQQIVAAFTLPNPGGGTLKLQANGRAGADLGKNTVSAALKGKLDDSSFDAKFGVTAFAPLATTFDVGLDRIDLDRYRDAGSQQPAAPSPSKEPAVDTPVDLSALKDLRTNGNLRIGMLKVQNIRATNVRAAIRAAGGKAEISSLQASLYGGTLAGSLSATASKQAQIAVRQVLRDVNVGTLLKDAIDKNPIDGKGDVDLDVTMQGATVSQMKNALNGNMRLVLRDGAVRGINIAQVVRDAKTKLGALRGDAEAQTGTASVDQKTDFSELSGSFRIARGIARNDDLQMKSPLIRLSGAGDINLVAERIDYLAKATVVPTLQGQGGPELQELKGLTVPVRLTGPFTSIGWRIDFKGLVKEATKQKFEEKKEEMKTRLQEQLNNKLKSLFGK